MYFVEDINLKTTSRMLAKLTLALIVSSNAYSESFDLLTLYENAVNYDAGIAAAKAAYQAEQQDEDSALANLLPNIVGSASVGDTNDNKNLQADQNYKTTNYSVSLTQPLIDITSWYSYSASEQNTLRAEADYLSAQQELILNIASAYFGVLRAEEDLVVAKALQAAVKRQYEQAKEQFDVGLIAITDVHEAKASFDDSNTTRIRAEGNVTLAKEQLSRLTGKFISKLHTLKADFPIAIDESASSDAWVTSAEQNNLQIRIAEYAMQTLKSQFEASKGGHYPTLNLTAGYDYTELNEYSPADSENENSSIFLNLNVPIFTGGATQANVRKTRFLLEQARFQLESAKRQARIEARTEFINLRTDIQAVESLSQNIVSRESALEATREGYKVGTRNIVEVLNAERNYYTALRDFASARFDFVESSLRIKRAAGTLSIEDIQALNQWLERSSDS